MSDTPQKSGAQPLSATPEVDLNVAFDLPSVFVNSASVMGSGPLVRMAFIERIGSMIIRPRVTVTMLAVDAKAIAEAILAALAVPEAQRLDAEAPPQGAKTN